MNIINFLCLTDGIFTLSHSSPYVFISKEDNCVSQCCLALSCWGITHKAVIFNISFQGKNCSWDTVCPDLWQFTRSSWLQILHRLHPWFVFLPNIVEEQTFRFEYLQWWGSNNLLGTPLIEEVYICAVQQQVKHVVRSCNSSHHTSQSYRYFYTATLFYWALDFPNL